MARLAPFKLPDGPPAYPPLRKGAILAGTSGAGDYFPQFTGTGGERLDETLGDGFWLIDRRDSATARLGVFGADIDRWLEAHQAEAVLVRPDRYVFGTGTPVMLAAAWAAALSDA